MLHVVQAKRKQKKQKQEEKEKELIPNLLIRKSQGT